jgi:hypothetical protein
VAHTRRLVRAPCASPSWERLESPCSFAVDSGGLSLSFDLVAAGAPRHVPCRGALLLQQHACTRMPACAGDGEIFVAYFLPFTFTDCQRLLRVYDVRHGGAVREQVRVSAACVGYVCACLLCAVCVCVYIYVCVCECVLCFDVCCW